MNSKDGVDIAVLFAHWSSLPASTSPFELRREKDDQIGRESRRSSDPVLLRQRRTVADPPEEDFTLDAAARRGHTSNFKLRGASCLNKVKIPSVRVLKTSGFYNSTLR